MRTRIAIDPNVRLKGNETYAGFEDVQDVQDVPDVGDEVEVWEPESRVVGFGRVTAIDNDRRLIYLTVDWASLSEDPIVTTLGAAMGRATIGPVRIRIVSTGEVVQENEPIRGDHPEGRPQFANT